MIDFGFGLSRSSAVRLDEVDLTLYRKLEKLEPGVRTCMSCGSCTATCTAGPWSGMSVRKVILDLQRERASAEGHGEVRKMLSACMLCGKCSMVCPRGINTRHLILSLCRIYEEKK
ncbi:MAG: 4Fe-4S dicluster domain-containing protein [Bacteroidales bacterium]|nr:4Fe-4S dicluster domain-containing protein [Bacteroidales bacterium]